MAFDMNGSSLFGKSLTTTTDDRVPYELKFDSPHSTRAHELAREYQKAKRDKMFHDLVANSDNLDPSERLALEAKLARMRETDVCSGSVRPISPYK